MTAVTYYRCSLLAPLLVTLGLWGAASLLSPGEGPLEDRAQGLGWFLIVVGVPYAAAAAKLFVEMWDMVEEGIAELLWVAPLKMVPVCAAVWVLGFPVVMALSGDVGSAAFGLLYGVIAAIIGSPLVLLFGYLYAALVAAGLSTLRSTGAVE
jgi:hypothetical protein